MGVVFREEMKRGLTMPTLIITRDAFDFIAHASRNTEPEEFVGLLRKNKQGVIDTILVVPLSEFGHGFSSINFSMLPLKADYCGSAHSHPNGYPAPSRQDRLFFSKIGGVHIILVPPYAPQSARAYDDRGKEIALKIVPTPLPSGKS